MHRHVRIGIVSDSKNLSIAETYLSLLQGSAYSGAQCSLVAFDPHHPARATPQIEKYHIALAHIGTPGRRDYKDHLHGFLEAYAAARRKPPTGLVTHDSEHTRYVINNWLDGSLHRTQELPDGLLNIIDASRPLRHGALEKTVGILLGRMLPLPARKSHAIPFPQVLVASLRSRRNRKDVT